MLTEGRLQWIKSYLARHAVALERHALRDTETAMLMKFILQLIPEVERLRDVLKDIGNDLSNSLQHAATAKDSLQEPPLGPPDFICKRSGNKTPN